MPYAFRLKDHSVAKAARRIADEQISRALIRIAAPEPLSAEDIHDLRTTVKRLRGLIGLIGPGLDDAKAQGRALRDAARAISAPRDSEVMLATLDVLAPEGLPTLRAALQETHHAAHADHALDAGLSDYGKALAKSLKRAEGWSLKSKGFGALEAGLAATFATARDDWHAARARGKAEALHETRKWIKAHGYHARLLEPIWPEMMATHRAVVDDLGETLGLMNDLAVFTRHLDTLDLPGAERDSARARADARHAELMTAVLPRADKFLSEPPEALTERWRGWWRWWRKEG